MNEIFKKQKKEILDWVENLENEDVIKKLLDIKYDVENSVYEARAEYAVKDDFEERWEKAISHQEMKSRTLNHISNLPWKH
jgi:hypothetical protein